MADSVVHFEIPVDKMDRAQKFYKETFGWAINAMPEMEYASLERLPPTWKEGLLNQAR